MGFWQFNMKQQSIGIVLCALLLTTFGHELLQRHQVARSARIARSPKVAQPHAKSHFLERAQTTSSPSDVCITACFGSPDNGSNSLVVSVNISTGIVGVANKTAGVGIIIDVKADLVLIFNASSELALIINLETQIGKVIKLEISTSIEIFLASCVSLTVYYNQNGTTFSGNNLPANCSLMISVVFTFVIGGNVTATGKNVFILFIQIMVKFTVSFKVVGQVLKSGTFTVAINFQGLVVILEGLVAGISQINGGVSTFVQKNITFTLTLLVSLRTSVQIAVYLVLTLAINGVEVTSITDVIAALDFLAAFSGNSTVGVNGVFYVLATIVGFINGKVSILTVIDIVVRYCVDNNGNINLAGEFGLAINATIKTLQSNTNLNQGLTIILGILISISSNNLVIGGVNLSSIIELLLSVDIVLKVIIGILVLLEVKIAIELAIINLFVYLFALLVGGSLGVVSLVIGVVITNVGNLVALFTKALIASGGNVWEAINSVQVLVQIVVQLDAICIALGLNITAKGIFSPSGVLKVIIQLLLQLGIPISFGISLRKGGNDRLSLGPGPVIRPDNSDIDSGGSASGNSSQIMTIGGIVGTDTKTNNSGGTSSVLSNGAINIWSQNGNTGGDVSHEDGNNSTGKGAQGNNTGYNYNNHQGGYASGSSSQHISIGNISGTNTDTENSGGNNTVESIGNVNLWPVNGNHGGDVSHHDNNNNNSTRHHKKEGEKHGIQQKEKKARLHEKRQQA